MKTNNYLIFALEAVWEVQGVVWVSWSCAERWASKSHHWLQLVREDEEESGSEFQSPDQAVQWVRWLF